MFISARVCRTTLGRGRTVRTASSSVQTSCRGRARRSTTATTTRRPHGTSGHPPGGCTRGTTQPRPAAEEGPAPAATMSLLPRAAGDTTTSRSPRGTAGTTTPPGHLLVSSATARRPSRPGKGSFTGKTTPNANNKDKATKIKGNFSFRFSYCSV